MSSDESIDKEDRIAEAIASSQQKHSEQWAWCLGWLYIVVLLLAWLCLRYGADRHWSGTLLEFGPRWILLMPIPAIALLALCYQRRHWWIVALASLIGAGPLTGLCVPLPLRLDQGESPAIRVMTLNTDGRASPSEVIALAESTQADVLCLQECYRPETWLQSLGAGWHVRYEDEFLIASRFPISKLEPLAQENAIWDRLAVRCQIAGPLGTIRLVNLHTHSPRVGLESVLHRQPNSIVQLEENSRRREEQSQRIAQWVRAEEGPILLVGDFNRSVGSLAYEDCWGRYLNAYTEAGVGWGATFFSRWHGVRIDHILASRDFQALDCWVAGSVGSAHRPVIATLQIVR